MSRNASNAARAEPSFAKLARLALPRSFYARHTLEVARELLGKLLLVRTDPTEPFSSPLAGVTVGRIVETEAYRGEDPASHSSRGETPRTAVMFGKPGVAYVYFIYGMYEMLNFVTEPQGQPGAVLIRAVEPVRGEELMEKRRKVRVRRELTNGPGRLCRALGIRMSHNRESLRGPALYVCDDGFSARSAGAISVSQRVGIKVGTEQPWRFFLTGNEFVSRVPQNKEAFPWK